MKDGLIDATFLFTPSFFLPVRLDFTLFIVSDSPPFSRGRNSAFRRRFILLRHLRGWTRDDLLGPSRGKSRPSTALPQMLDFAIRKGYLGRQHLRGLKKYFSGR